MENKILVVGSINVDIFNLKPKKQYKGAVCPNSKLMDIFVLPGGKGANQAAVASWLGAKTYMLGFVGDDEMGAWALSILQSQGVDVSRVVKSQKNPTSVITIAHNKSGKNQYLVSPGANTEMSKKYIDKNIDLIKKCNVVLTQLETPKPVVEHLANICNKLNIPIILNPDPKIDFDKKFLAKFQYLTPNADELSKKDINWLLKNTNTQIIQTLGKHGACWYQKDGKHKMYKCKKRNVVSTIGAGDTFSGTLAYCIANKIPLSAAIKKGIKNSSWSIGQLGAQKLPKK